MVSIRDVAKKAQVSVGTVSRYLNGQTLRDDNMERIQSAIKVLGYRQNIIAKGLKNSKSFTIGLLMNNLSSRLSMDIVSAIEEILENAGYEIALSGFNDDKYQFKNKLDYFQHRLVDGLIIFEAEENWPGMDELANSEIPIISLNSPNHLKNVDSILTNDKFSVVTVMNTLINRGNKKIGIIVAPQRDYSSRERLAGIKEIQEKNSNIQIITYKGDYSRLSGYRGADTLVSYGIDALFVCNYNMSLGAMEYFSRTNLRIDTDISFAHFDYLDELNQISSRRLIIQQPAISIGKMCAKRLLSRINGTASDIGSTYIFKNKIIGIK